MITLRQVELTDAQVIFGHGGRYPENFAYLTVRAFEDVVDAQRYLTSLFPNSACKAFHIVEAQAGVVGLVKVAVDDHGAKIGYVINRPFWRRGIGTQALGAVVRQVESLPNISRIWATCALDNPASARVLEKCGFEREGILRNWVTYPALGGKPLDNYSYVKIPGHSR